MSVMSLPLKRAVLGMAPPVIVARTPRGGGEYLPTPGDVLPRIMRSSVARAALPKAAPRLVSVEPGPTWRPGLGDLWAAWGPSNSGRAALPKDPIVAFQSKPGSSSQLCACADTGVLPGVCIRSATCCQLAAARAGSRAALASSCDDTIKLSSLFSLVGERAGPVSLRCICSRRRTTWSLKEKSGGGTRLLPPFAALVPTTATQPALLLPQLGGPGLSASQGSFSLTGAATPAGAAALAPDQTDGCSALPVARWSDVLASVRKRPMQ